MKPHLRSLGLRVAVVLATTAALFGVSTAAPAPPLPIALLASFDEAFALVSEAAEQRIADLEQPPPVSARSPTVTGLLARLEREVGAACNKAHDAVIAALAGGRSSNGSPNWSPHRRASVLSVIDRQLAEAHDALACTTDPEVRAEYEQTYTWLREIRFLV